MGTVSSFVIQIRIWTHGVIFLKTIVTLVIFLADIMLNLTASFVDSDIFPGSLRIDWRDIYLKNFHHVVVVCYADESVPLLDFSQDQGFEN